jgi:hypothetical protein
VDGDDEALAWVDERSRLLLAGEDPASISALQLGYSDRPWYEQACGHYGPQTLAFFARNADFDPATVIPDVRCPVFAAFGGADTSVPVPRSVAVLSELLPGNSAHAIAVFPDAGHGLMPGTTDQAASYAARLAPGFLPMLTRRTRSGAVSPSSRWAGVLPVSVMLPACRARRPGGRAACSGEPPAGV